MLFSTLVFSQDLCRQAEENPLSTVLYLLSTTEKDSKEEQKACLAKSFAKVNKFGESEKAAQMFVDGGYAEEDLIAVVKIFIESKKTKEASEFASLLLKRFENDGYRLKNLWEPLVTLNRTEEALNIADQYNDDDKVDAYFLISEALLKIKKNAKVVEILNKISPIVEKSKYDKDKAKLALFYAKLGKEKKSLQFANESLKKVVWETKSGILAPDDSWIVRDVFDAYLILGKYDLAFELLQKQDKTDEPKSIIKIADSYIAKGNYQKANELFEKSLKQLNPKDYSDSFDLGNIIEIYLKIGEIEKAKSLTKSLTGSNYLQQELLLKIADFYIKKKNKTKASEILNFALEQTKKIDTSEAENGSLWTSGKWDQAKYQSQIAIRLIDMQLDKKALELISQLKKPYLKALILTEFVSVNKKRILSKQLNAHLEEALLLLRRKRTDVFDSKRFDVLAITARNFAEIGMTEKANDVFAETLSLLDKEMIENGSDSSLLFAMCNIGVEFEKSKIKANEKMKESLRNIIKNWENEEY